MPKQTGIVPLQGTLGNITFSKSGKVNRAQEKTYVSPTRFTTDPRFERARENAAEFTKAANGAKLLRFVLEELIKNFSSKKTSGRIHSAMMKVVKGDASHGRGLRLVNTGNFEFLEGFEFNERNELKSVLPVGYTTTIDRTAGTMIVEIPAFIPRQKIVLAPGATHFRIVAAAAEIDFETEAYKADFKSTPGITWTDIATTPATLSMTVTPNSVSPLILVLGLEFYQEVMGLPYVLKGSDYHALSVVKASGL